MHERTVDSQEPQICHLFLMEERIRSKRDTVDLKQLIRFLNCDKDISAEI